ncbi:MAG TPA: class I SAM-dependent methyltransferase [Thermoanaerobaculia bacterium]
MDERYVRRYRQLYESHWWWRAREDLLLRTISRIMPARRLQILDVGCGDGLFFEKLSRFGEVSGVEGDPAGVTASSPWAGRIHVGAFDASYRPAQRFDLVLFLDVLEHLDDPAAALRRALELLAPDGRILVTVPAYRSLWTTHDDLNRHRERYTRRSLLALADSAGARALETKYFFAWVAPVKLAQHVVERVFPKAPEPPAILPSALNRALYQLSRFEQRLLGRHSSPWGSSLLGVLAGSPGAS